MKIPPIIIKLNQMPAKKSKKHKHKRKHHKHHHHHHKHHEHSKDDGEKFTAPQAIQMSHEEQAPRELPMPQESPEPQEFPTPQEVPLTTLEDQQQTSKVKSHPLLSFIRLQDDGSTTLTIIGPSTTEHGLERVINLEQVCGQLVEGLETLPSDIDEDELRETHQVRPIDYVESTAYSSHLPLKDSTFASLTKEDSETLLEVYGNNETCFEYARSIQDFAAGTGFCTGMVDSLLDLLTDNKHKTVAAPIIQNDIQSRLDEIDALLEQLKLVQNRRLSSSAAPVKPDDEETSIASQVSARLTKIIEKTRPADISDSASILKALGINVKDC